MNTKTRILMGCALSLLIGLGCTLLLRLDVHSAQAQQTSNSNDRVRASAQTPEVQQKEADGKLLAGIRAKAEKGDAKSQFDLGLAFLVGHLGITIDKPEAVKWFRKAAEQNYPAAQHTLGVCYETGQGVTQDLVEGVKWYRKAAERNYAEAQNNLGVCYLLGNGVPEEPAEAVKYFRKAVDQGHPGAQNNLGRCYDDGKGVAKDPAEAMKWYRKAAEQGLASAQLNLGLMYLETYDSEEAMKWFQLAADQGHPQAQYNLGLLWEKTGNYDEAVKWYRKAAAQNYADAQCNLGLCYAQGHGVPQDFEEAAKLYHKAAEQNFALAQFNLGGCYQDGKGAPKDHAEAMKWYLKAAEQNLTKALVNLGTVYDEDNNPQEALRWYRKAAEQNDACAQFNLALSLWRGEGTARNPAEAYKWMLLAAVQKWEGAANAQARMERGGLTQEQAAAGLEAARNFKPRRLPPPSRAIFAAGIMETGPASFGSGFFITEDGYFITNHHVVRNAQQVRLLTSFGFVSANVVKLDPANDLAMLKAEGRFPALPVVASSAVRLGSMVATVGFPMPTLQGFSPKLAKGEIAALTGTATDDLRYFQISLPVQHGNSGGALVNELGNVVGVVSAKIRVSLSEARTSDELPENVNLAIKSRLVLSLIESVPGVSGKLKVPSSKERKFEDMVESTRQAAAQVVVY